MNMETAKASSEESKKYASNQGYKTTTFEMNVQDDKSVQAMVDFVVKEFGRLDYAVNAAGVSLPCWAFFVQSLHLLMSNRSTTASMLPSPRQMSPILTAS